MLAPALLLALADGLGEALGDAEEPSSEPLPSSPLSRSRTPELAGEDAEAVAEALEADDELPLPQPARAVLVRAMTANAVHAR